MHGHMHMRGHPRMRSTAQLHTYAHGYMRALTGAGAQPTTLADTHTHTNGRARAQTHTGAQGCACASHCWRQVAVMLIHR